MPTDFVMKKGDYGHELLILVRGVARSVPDTEAGETSSQEYEMGVSPRNSKSGHQLIQNNYQ